MNSPAPLSREDRKCLDSIRAKLALKGYAVDCHPDGSYEVHAPNPKGNWRLRDLHELHQFSTIYFG